MTLLSRLAPGSRGAQAETRACDVLRAAGLDILERNYRTRRGEIDIVADDAGTVVFVEVRWRGSDDFGGAAASVDSRKQQRLISTAEHYLCGRGWSESRSCRFDVICLGPGEQRQWIRDAFRPEV